MNTEFITKPTTNMLQRLLSNKHTSISAVVYVVAKLLCKLGTIWVPSHQQQFEQTADMIESAAVGYGLIMAGDSKPQGQQETK